MSSATPSGLPTPTHGRPHPYVQFVFATEPITASLLGAAGDRCRLDDVDPDALADHADRRERFLAAAEADTPAPRGSIRWLDQQVLLAELRSAVRQQERQNPYFTAAYLYPERAGQALSVLMTRPDPVSGEALLGRLLALPGYLERAGRNLTPQTPRPWAAMGAKASEGLARFVGSAVAEFAGALPASLATSVATAARRALPAVEDFAAVAGRLAQTGVGRWQAGREQVDFLLRTAHGLDMDADQLAEHGRDLVSAARSDLEKLAAQIDPEHGWRDQIDRAKAHHPDGPAFVQAYRTAMRAARRHTVQTGLVTVPEGTDCVVGWVPDYLRESLPMGVMNPTPPYAPGLRSDFLITPLDPTADPDAQRQHLRDNNFAFIASIAGHETFPGHHLQAVHHKLATPYDSIRRYARSPQFVEGWGLYVEDLLDESGLLADPATRLTKYRNTLWRCLRIVVDVGLHTGTLDVPAATELLHREAGMDQHMAAGEVRRYTRHDNPTYPSSYVLGRNLIHRLRAHHRTAEGRGSDMRSFHDRLLAFGSPPLPLLAPVLDQP